MDNNENEVLTNEPAQSEVPEQAEQTVEPSSMHDALFPESESVDPAKSVDEADKANEDDATGQPDPDAKEEEDDHTPPDGLTPKASERFQRLANENKAYRELGTPEQIQAMRADVDTLNEFRSRIIDSQMNQQELEGVFEYTKALKSGDFATVGKFLQEQVYQFEMLSGQRLNVDPLGAYPDLKQRADGMEDESVVFEAARGRYIHEMQQRQQAQLQQQQQTIQMQEYQDQVARQQAVDDLSAWAVDVARTDILWQERAPKINEFIQNGLKDLLPNQWKPAVQAFYTALSQAQNTPASRSPNALRPNNLGTASGNKAPANMHEAMWG